MFSAMTTLPSTDADKYGVRKYDAEDYPAVVDLWRVCFPNDPPWDNPADIVRHKLAQQPELFLVCVFRGALVGTVLVGYDGYRGWINKLATHPDHQYKGVATLLLKTAENKLIAMGCPKINLQVRADNAEVIGLYMGAGFAVEPLISMGKRLPTGQPRTSVPGHHVLVQATPGEQEKQ